MAFGKMRNQSGTVSNAWLFTGRQFDSESGLYYLRNRYYDPKTGRFITRDPIGIAGGINLYQYCGNNPVNWIDPWGLCKEESLRERMQHLLAAFQHKVDAFLAEVGAEIGPDPVSEWLNEKLGIDDSGRYFSSTHYWSYYSNALVESSQGVLLGAIVTIYAPFPCNMVAGALTAAETTQLAVDAYKAAWIERNPLKESPDNPIMRNNEKNGNKKRF